MDEEVIGKEGGRGRRGRGRRRHRHQVKSSYLGTVHPATSAYKTPTTSFAFSSVLLLHSLRRLLPSAAMSTTASSSLSAILDANLADQRKQNSKKTSSRDGAGPSTLAELLGLGNIASYYHPAAVDDSKPADLFSTTGSAGDRANSAPSCNMGMCAEILGSENGCHVIDNDVIFFADDVGLAEQARLPALRRRRTAVMNRSEMPPPLRTMSGLKRLCMNRRRDEDRLVMTVTVRPSPARCYVAERGNGRLLLQCDMIRCEEEEGEGSEGKKEEVLGEMVIDGGQGKRCEEKARKIDGVYWESGIPGVALKS